ncbi:MAG TPA: hypothetical protein PLQ09_02845 [Prolixibacteraceae bacterium]|nr:hypothetical protein [Prolixibacteraceae bacterium]
MNLIKKYKTAVVFTGSGGSFSQETAIVDQLIKTGKIQLNEDTTLLIGSGSGALNLVAINACFRKDNPCSWDNFFKNKFIPSIADNETFIKVDPIHWITLPQRKKYNELLQEAGFSTISDLPFDSIILTSVVNENKTKWINSRAKKERELNLDDILMASSAIPVIFPPHQLNSNTESVHSKFLGAHYEGSTCGLLNKFKKQLGKIILEHGPFEQIFILSPKRLFDYSPVIHHDLSMMIAQEKYQFNQFLNHISLHSFLTFLIKLQKNNSKNRLAKTISVSIPEMDQNVGLLDYTDQYDKYVMVKNWFEKNPDRLAIDISAYINEMAFVPSFSENYCFNIATE